MTPVADLVLCGVALVLVIAVEAWRAWRALRPKDALGWHVLERLARELGLSVPIDATTEEIFTAIGLELVRLTTRGTSREAAARTARQLGIVPRWYWPRYRIFRAVGAQFAALRLGLLHVEPSGPGVGSAFEYISRPEMH